MDGRGYKLPDNPSPEGFRCIALLIPDDDEYLYALGGAYEFFTHWNAWQRDSGKNGRFAAAAWQAAYDLTMSDYWTEGLIMSCFEVQQLIDSINLIATQSATNAARIEAAIRAIDNNFNPLDCVPCEDRTYIPPVPDDNPDFNNPPVGGDENGYRDYLCRATNYMWYQHVMNGGAELMNMNALGGGVLGTGAVIAVMYASGIGAPIAFAASIIAAIIAIGFIYDQAQLADELERLAQSSICAIVQSDGAQDAVDNLRASLIANNADQSVIDYVMAATGINAMNKLFAGEIVVPDSFIAPKSCVCTEPALPAPTNYQFVPVVYGAVLDSGANYGNITMSVQGNRLTAVYASLGNAGGNRFIEIDVTATLAAVGYNIVDNPPLGIYTNTVESFAANDMWRVIDLGGSVYDWSPRFPFAGQGKQGFISDASIWNEQAIQDFSTAVFADFGGATFANVLDVADMEINANHNDPSQDLIIDCWLMVAIP